ncbi:MAG: BTAD domain-containing putative transcriptional regulator, partial [Gemmatimonadaceae bacterium]
MFVLRTLGRFSLERISDGTPILENQRKALALLALLAASRSAVSRDRLMSLLWSESDDARARGSIKQLLHLIRRQIGRDDAIEGLAELRLNPAAISSDVGQFRTALATGDDVRAISLYTAPFLDGVFIEGADEFERWVAIERNELSRQFAEALERLAATATRDGRNDDAVGLWRRLQETDPTNGRLAVGLMTALHAEGDRAGAIRHARIHQTLLQEELGAPAEARVLSYLEELLREPPTRRTPAPALPVIAASAPSANESPEVSRETRTTAEEPQHQSATASPKTRRLAYVLSAVAAGVLIATSWWYGRGAITANDAGFTQPGRVAVSVLVNRTNDQKLDAIGMMASDWLTRGLSRLPSVDVVEPGGLYLRGRTAAGDIVDPVKMARENGASVVVAGNYYYQNANHDSITFSAQVIDVATGRIERALEPVSAATNEPIAALEELRQRVSTALGALLDPRAPMLNSPLLLPPKLDAYSEFLTGQETYWRGDWESSLPHFRRAAALDSMFYTATAFVSIAAVGTGHCEIVDSIAQEFKKRGSRIPE